MSKRFRIRETLPVFVTWIYEVEAEDRDEAMTIYKECPNDVTRCGHEISDSIETMEQQLDIEEV